MLDTHGFVEDKMKKDEYGRIGFGPVSSSSSTSPCSAARAAASAALSKANSAALMGSLEFIRGGIKLDVNKTMSSKESFMLCTLFSKRNSNSNGGTRVASVVFTLMFGFVPNEIGMFKSHPTHSLMLVSQKSMNLPNRIIDES